MSLDSSGVRLRGTAVRTLFARDKQMLTNVITFGGAAHVHPQLHNFVSPASHKVNPMSPSSTNSTGPLDDRDESVTVSVRTLGDSSSSSDSGRVYYLSRPPLRAYLQSTRAVDPSIIANRLRQWCGSGWFLRPCIEDIPRELHVASIRRKKGQFEDSQSKVLPHLDACRSHTHV